MLLFGHIGITLGSFYIISRLTKHDFDYRFVLIGSLLPDILDKLVGRVALPLGSGRLFGHTLLFVLVLALISLWKRKALTLSLASALHLAEDEMWEQPKILLWPIFGNFPTSDPIPLYQYILTILKEYTSSLSYTFISEVVGLMIILAIGSKKILTKFYRS